MSSPRRKKILKSLPLSPDSRLLIILLEEHTVDIIDVIFLHKHICYKSKKLEMWHHDKWSFIENFFKSFGTRVKAPV